MNTIKQGSTVKATSKKLTKQLPAHVSVFGEVVRVIPKQPKKHQTYEVYWFVDCIGFKSRNKFVTGRSVAVVHPWTPTIESFVDSILLEVAHGDDDCPDLIDDGTPEVTPSRENLSPPTPPMFLDSCSDTDPEWNLRPRDPFRWKIVRCHRPGRPPFFYYNEGLNMTSWTMPRDEGGDKEGDEKGDESMVVIEEPCVREGDGADDEEDEDEEDEDEEDEDELDLDVPVDVDDDLMKARIFRNKCPKTIKIKFKEKVDGKNVEKLQQWEKEPPHATRFFGLTEQPFKKGDAGMYAAINWRKCGYPESTSVGKNIEDYMLMNYPQNVFYAFFPVT